MASALRRGPLTQEQGQRLSSALDEMDAAASGALPQFAAVQALTAAFPNTPVFFYTVDPNSQDSWFVSNFSTTAGCMPSGDFSVQACSAPPHNSHYMSPVEAELRSLREPSRNYSPHLLHESTSLPTQMVIGSLLDHPATPVDHAVLSALQAPLAQWSTAALALQLWEPAASCLSACLNAFAQAAFIFDPSSSRLILSNHTAQQCQTPPAWLSVLANRQLTQDQLQAQILQHGSITALRPRNFDLWLVVSTPSAPIVPAPLAPPMPSLPPTLGQTAQLLCQGASDKDIAHALGVEHSTARTYTSRVLKKLQLSGRRELMQRFVSEDFAPNHGTTSSHPPSSGRRSRFR